ncbi:MAG: PAS domain S-box protein [Deltaproteobacteria bacterium]|nr:PAS domain S-box protein [Deltaproteobacteria bacterium]
MHDPSKTKQELIEENALLKQRIQELKISQAECKRENDALRESEEKYRILLSESPDPACSFSPEGQYRYVNRAFAEVVGKPVEDIIGKSIWDVFPKEEADNRFASLSQVFRTGEEKVIEVRVPRAGGDRYYVTTITPIKDMKGKMLSALCSSKDITDRKRAEEELQKTTQTLKAIIDASPLAIFTLDHDLRVTNWSPAAELIFGWSSEEAIGQYNPIVPAEKWDDFKALVSKVLSGIAYSGSEVWRQTKDGRFIFVTVSTSPLRDAHGKVVGAMGVIQDITERKQAEEALRKSEEMLRLITDNMSDMIRVTDLQGVNLYTSPSHFKGLGYRPEDRVGKPTFDIVHPDDMERIINLFSEALAVKAEYRVRHADGHYVWLETVADLHRDAQGNLTAVVMSSRDISERKAIAEELSRNEEKYRTLIETTRTGFVIIDKDGLVLDANPEYVRLTGHHNLSEIVGRSVIEWTADHEKEKNAAAVGECFKKGYIRNLEIDYVDAKGSITPIEINATYMETGGIAQILTLCRDISDRKQTEAALRESEERFRAFMDNMPSMVLIKDKELRPLFFNRRFSEMFPANEWLGKLPEETFPSEIAASMRENDLKALSEGFVTYEEEWHDKDGSLLVLETRKFSIDQKDKAPLLGAIITDITDRRQAEEAMWESQRRLADIIEFLPDATLVIDSEGKVIAWNRAIESMTGIRAEAMLGKGNYEYAIPFYGERRPILIDLALHPDQEKEKTFTSIQRTGDIIFREAYTPALATGNAHLSATASMLRNSKGEIIGAIECIRNNTDRKNMEERLQRAERMESLGVLAGGVAHDLNNVLGVLVGYSELLMREVTEGSRTEKYAKSILHGGERAAAIIQDLLTMARRGVSVSDTVNLNHIVADSFKTPEFELVKSRHPDILFQSQVEMDLFNIKGSPVHLSKTIMNLLSNAAESICGTGVVTITTDNRYVDVPIPGYENTREGEYVVLTVTDTGSGISPADMGRIFEPFYTKKIMGRSGTGLGLAVVWGTVKDHNGYIDVRTEENKGSTFTLYFPVTRDALSKSDQALSQSEYRGRGETILIVDDVEEQRFLAATILEGLNYRVAMVANGEDAVKYLRTNKADLIVLDMIMDPGIDGLETYRRIMEIQPRQKAIIVSGFAKTERVSKAQELGAGEYVMKPYVIEKIGVAVRKELDRI